MPFFLFKELSLNNSQHSLCDAYGLFIWTIQNTRQRKKLEAIHASRRLRYRRNGHYQETMLQRSSFANKGEFGEATIEVPHDRNSEFEPVMLKTLLLSSHQLGVWMQGFPFDEVFGNASGTFLHQEMHQFIL